jgi:hypothetical protein
VVEYEVVICVIVLVPVSNGQLQTKPALVESNVLLVVLAEATSSLPLAAVLLGRYPPEVLAEYTGA